MLLEAVDSASCKGKRAMPPNEPCPHCGQLILDWHIDMILTRNEISFLDVYCHEGTEPPFGDPATAAMACIGVHSGDTLNLQWAYLRDNPPDRSGHRQRQRNCSAASLAQS
jgi:hypothetical protein